MDKVSIELPLAAWGVVMQALGRQPYAEVFEIVAEIKRQGDAAVKPDAGEDNA